MTVSLKRLIASLVLIAMALAGTPTKALANDGLDMIRYGFKTEKQELEVYRPVSANLNKNPFRDKTVSATLRGADIRIERSTLAERNIAKLLNPENTRDAVVIKPVMIDHTICQVYLPVFQNAPQGNLMSAWRNQIDQAVELGQQIAKQGLAYVESGLEAEMQFATSLTAASREHEAPLLAKLPAWQLPSAVEISDESDSSQSVKSLATISNISESEIEIPALVSLPTQTLKRMNCHNIHIAMLEGSEEDGFSPGQQLLIEEYMPTTVPTIKAKSAALKVPAMSIGYQKKTEVKDYEIQEIKGYEIQEPAQINPVIKKTLDIWNEMVRPLMNVEQAATIAAEVYQQLELGEDFHGSLRKFERWGSYGDIR